MPSKSSPSKSLKIPNLPTLKSFVTWMQCFHSMWSWNHEVMWGFTFHQVVIEMTFCKWVKMMCVPVENYSCESSIVGGYYPNIHLLTWNLTSCAMKPFLPGSYPFKKPASEPTNLAHMVPNVQPRHMSSLKDTSSVAGMPSEQHTERILWVFRLWCVPKSVILSILHW